MWHSHTLDGRSGGIGSRLMSLSLVCVASLLWAQSAIAAAPAIDNAGGASNVTAATAWLNANLTSTGGVPTTVRLYWDTADQGTSSTSAWTQVWDFGEADIGVYSNEATSLSAGTMYYYRAYATNADGESWSDVSSFTTLGLTPVVDNAGGASNVTATTAWLNANLNFTGGVPTTVRLYWDTADQGTSSTSAWTQVWDFGEVDIGVYSHQATSLTPGAMYYYRAYATNSGGQAWSAMSSFTTLAQAPAVDNGSGASGIGSTTATLNGNLTSTGGAATVVYCFYGTNDGGTNKSAWVSVADLGALSEGAFSTNITGLTPNTLYYYRSYASNSVSGVWAAGSSQFGTFGMPNVSNGSGATGMSTNSATLNGNLTATGGAPTSVWIYWGLSDGGSDKTAWANNVSMGVLPGGAFSTSVSPLNPNTLYYYRCYASNVVGDAWASSTASFTTLGDGGTVMRRVSASSDDVEEGTNGNVQVNSKDLDFVYNSDPGKGDQKVGIRFSDVLIPPGATILSAYIQFTARWSGDGSCTHTIRVETVDSSITFVTNSLNLSSRSLSATEVIWNPGAWIQDEKGTPERTSDLTALVQEIVNRPGWASGNAMMFDVMGGGPGIRTAWAYDGDSSNAPLLRVEWGVPAAPAAPVIGNRFGATAITTNSAQLNGDLESTGDVPTSVWIYWGTADGGSDKSAWANAVGLGVKSEETVSTAISTLNPSTLYYYRCYASNSVGEVWASGTEQFATTTGSDVTNGLVVHWKFDDGSGSAPVDSSGNGNTGTLVNSEPADWVAGKFGSALDFNGTNEYVYNTGLSSSLSGDMAISCWLLGGGALATDLSGSTSNNGLEIIVTGDRAGWAGSGGPSTNVSSSRRISPDEWHHVVIVREGTTYTLYVDGELSATGSGSVVSYSVLYVARRVTGNMYWVGLMDDVRVYDRALSWSEVGSLYAGEGGEAPPPPAGDDQDQDGMPDAWEIQYFGGTNAAMGGATEDYDQDGSLNLGEYVAGTDSTNDTSALTIVISGGAANVWVSYYSIEASGAFYTGLTRTYDLESTTNLIVGGWQGVSDATNIPGSNVVVNFVSPSVGRTVYYRVRTMLR